MPIYVEGEFAGHTPVEIRLMPRMLQVIGQR